MASKPAECTLLVQTRNQIMRSINFNICNIPKYNHVLQAVAAAAAVLHAHTLVIFVFEDLKNR